MDGATATAIGGIDRRDRSGRALAARAAWAWPALAAWAALIAAGWVGGTALNDAGADISLHAPPLFGYPDIRIGLAALIPAAFAGAVIVAAPALCRSLGWRPLLFASALGAFAWALALALADEPAAIARPFEGPSEYLGAVALVGSPGEFLSTFTERIDAYPTHVRSHPPGMVLVLWGLERIGLGGALPGALVTIGVGAAAAPAALLALRSVGGEARARLAAPYLVLVPGAVWIATTADALFMGVAAWAVALTVLAIGAEGRRSDLLAVGGGLGWGAALFLSYGLALLALIPLAVAVAARRARPLVVAGACTIAVALGVLAAGFWWVDGLAATREQYAGSIAQTRPHWYFAFGNLAAFALAAGPAAALALGRLRDRPVWLLVGPALAALLLADLSGMSKGEVERIWLPFLPWILLAAAALPGAGAWMRVLLAAQAAVAIAIQVGVRMPW
jgi:hypothetical protein